MTISTGQFGGVFWHDSEGNEAEWAKLKKEVNGSIL